MLGKLCEKQTAQSFMCVHAKKYSYMLLRGFRSTSCCSLIRWLILTKVDEIVFGVVNIYQRQIFDPTHSADIEQMKGLIWFGKIQRTFTIRIYNEGPNHIKLDPSQNLRLKWNTMLQNANNQSLKIMVFWFTWPLNSLFWWTNNQIKMFTRKRFDPIKWKNHPPRCFVTLVSTLSPCNLCRISFASFCFTFCGNFNPLFCSLDNSLLSFLTYSHPENRPIKDPNPKTETKAINCTNALTALTSSTDSASLRTLIDSSILSTWSTRKFP